ncbi:MAG TPA: GTP cyclohydrolase I [Candidatus Polarisedimenticolia bacterium]|nr:GTP cyclohydrolase I [Candidatus Polarisedimenticolia bacterium]
MKGRRSRAKSAADLFDRRKMERGVRMFLEGMGPIVSARDLRETPRQVTRAWSEELLAGYRSGKAPRLEPLPETFADAVVVVRDIRFVSICRHHLLPFTGKASLAYLPGGRIAGFSSMARLVEALARRLQIQEDLSEQILDRLEASLAPLGTACLLEATHQCMTCRGALQPGALVTTLRVRGVFQKVAALRKEIVALLQAPEEAMGRVS